MAVQDSFIKIKGTLGGLTFYEKDGKSLIKTSGGVDKERILNDPNYRRTRENMQEFGAAASLGKSMRLGFANISQELKTKALAGRVTGMMTRINRSGPGNRGERTFEIVNNKQLLEGFELQLKLPFRNVFYAPMDAPTIDANRSVVGLTIPDFNTQNYIKIPIGASHARLVLHASVLSDYAFDSSIGEYQFVNAQENEIHGSDFSTEIPLAGMVGSDTSLSVDLGLSSALPATAGVLVGVGILFYQEINGLYYSLANNNAFQIHSVF